MTVFCDPIKSNFSSSYNNCTNVAWSELHWINIIFKVNEDMRTVFFSFYDIQEHSPKELKETRFKSLENFLPLMWGVKILYS